MNIPLNKDPREEKRRIASDIRTRLSERGILAVNLISSPGSGKTTLLEKALPLLASHVRLHVIEADTATRRDADRLEAVGAPVAMIANAITGCHISPAAALTAYGEIDLDEVDLVVIENVGNLVCPAGVDLGEDCKIVMVSVAEGEDKPLKYPNIFMNASLAVINKVDAADALGADIGLLEENIRSVHPGIEIIRLSAKTGRNVDRFVNRILGKAAEKKVAAGT
jgi:hydrogenase nickel incorporation protein HypB